MVWKQVTRVSELRWNESDRKIPWRELGGGSREQPARSEQSMARSGDLREAGRQKFLEEGTSPGPDIHGAFEVRQVRDNAGEEPPVRFAGQAGLGSTVEIGLPVERRQSIGRRRGVCVEQVASLALREPPVHVFRCFPQGEGVPVKLVHADFGRREEA